MSTTSSRDTKARIFEDRSPGTLPFSTISLSVSDTGVGIPEDEISNMFKPFYTTKLKGMGLGLAYCKRAVEAHGGSISVESEVGVGTTFIATLPKKPEL